MQPVNQHSDADATGEEDVFESVAGRFGIQSSLIAELRRECMIFDEICADYEECWEKLQNLRRESQVAGQRASEYAAMRELLEGELDHCLKGVPPCRCRLKARDGKVPVDRLGPRMNQTSEHNHNAPQ